MVTVGGRGGPSVINAPAPCLPKATPQSIPPAASPPGRPARGGAPIAALEALPPTPTPPEAGDMTTDRWGWPMGGEDEGETDDRVGAGKTGMGAEERQRETACLMDNSEPDA